MSSMKRVRQWTRGERMAGWGVFAAVFVIAIGALWGSFTENRVRDLEAGSDLWLPVSQVKTGRLLLFRYPIDLSSAATVAVQRGPDGIVRAALASCVRCSNSRNFEQSGKLVCGHCRHVMKMPDPGTEADGKKTGCALPPLDYQMEGDRFHLRGDSIRAEFRRQFRRGAG